jgi:hypothetical protein
VGYTPVQDDRGWRESGAWDTRPYRIIIGAIADPIQFVRPRRGVYPTPTIIAIADQPIATVINLVGSQKSALNLELLNIDRPIIKDYKKDLILGQECT